MLINISNHPHEGWQPAQRKAAKAYGNIIDIPFPTIPPKATTAEVETMAVEYLNDILNLIRYYHNPPTVVHLMGEMTFTSALVGKLRAQGIPCVASTSKRISTVNGDTKKTTFKFIQFRPYF